MTKRRILRLLDIRTGSTIVFNVSFSKELRIRVVEGDIGKVVSELGRLIEYINGLDHVGLRGSVER